MTASLQLLFLEPRPSCTHSRQTRHKVLPMVSKWHIKNITAPLKLKSKSPGEQPLCTSEPESPRMWVVEAIQRKRHASPGVVLNNDRLQNPNVMCWNMQHTRTHTHSCEKYCQSPSEPKFRGTRALDTATAISKSLHLWLHASLFDHFGTPLRK